MLDNDEPIFITRPSLPPLDAFVDSLQTIWSTRVLTNGGPFHERFERELERYLNVPHVSLFCNATQALIVALKSLGLSGEVITTPFTFVATADAVKWCGLTPVFVDIDPNNLSISPSKVIDAITDKTCAILPVHVYGIPSYTEELHAISQRYGIPVIYDAAHAFGVFHKNKSLASAGDISVLSFHATKVLNTFEGGALVCHDAALKKEVDIIKNFGIASQDDIPLVGTNGKLSEVHSAIGLLQLEVFESQVHLRSIAHARYSKRLKSCAKLELIDTSYIDKYNYAYMPILFKDSGSCLREKVYRALREKNVFARKYFYPLLSGLPQFQSDAAHIMPLPIAESVASRVLCLPIYPDITESQIDYICNIIFDSLS